ncbi:uncharacterized protein LOC106160517 [Lingula anatina]|uniref:Uncharacterized protein LOC106160517 n=1 Tax=Lingula anatina TaxID=7574 RepID=A0A1S3I434_LINAN|nr:uncharacterized protein LOC106160517 [Lingula anatina]|eukprot:XP_013392591.1 uncharacterized protein LOC106160517 [Lingula anatina]
MKTVLLKVISILSLLCEGVSGYGGSPRPGDEGSVYFSNGSHILNFTTAGGYTRLGILPLTKRNHTRIVGLAVDVDDGVLFWSDISVENRGIYTTSLTAVDERKIIADCGEVHGLSVDWLSNQLYWTDTTKKEVLVSDYDGKYTKTIAFSGMLWPRGIVVDPIHSTIYWGDQGRRTIEHAQLDGSMRGTLVRKGIYWPNQLTINYADSKLYWVDAWNKTVWSCDLDGSHAQVQYDFRDTLQANPLFGIAADGTTMYFSTWYNGAIFSTDLDKKNNSMKVVLEGMTGGEMFSIAVASSAGQPMASVNLCDNKADCSHFCFTRMSLQDYVCRCPTYGGLALASDNKTCTEPTDYLFWTKKDTGQIGYLNPSKLYSGDTYLVAQSSRPVAVAYDPVDKKVYWSDVREKSVYRANLNGTSKQLFLPHTAGIGVVDGLAVDWRHRRLYFTNRRQPTQEGRVVDSVWHKIEMVSLDRTERWTMTTLPEKPRGLVVDGEKGYLYYTDWGKHPKVIRTELDGANPAVLRDTNISNPNSLSLYQGKLYMVDSNYNRKARRPYVAVYDTETGIWNDMEGPLVNVQVPLSIASFGQHIVLSEWTGQQKDMGRLTIYNMDSGESQNLSVYGNPTGLFYSTALVSHTENISLVCSASNCDDICIPTPPESGTECRCQCSDLTGKVLSKNGKSCVAPENFVLFADLNTIKLINLDNPSDRHIYTLVQGSYNANFVAMVYEQKERRIFWADLKSPRLLTVPLDSPGNVTTLLHLNYAVDSMVIVDQFRTQTDQWRSSTDQSIPLADSSSMVSHTDKWSGMINDQFIAVTDQSSKMTNGSVEISNQANNQTDQTTERSIKTTDWSRNTTDGSSKIFEWSSKTYDGSGQITDRSGQHTDGSSQTTMQYNTDQTKAVTVMSRTSTVKPSKRPGHSLLYWVGYNATVGLIACVELSDDGQLVPRILTTGLVLPRALAVDWQNGFIYWTEYGLHPSIKRVTTDGHNMQTVASDGLRWPNSVIVHPAPDVNSSFLLVADGYYRRIEKMRLDGSQRHGLKITEDLPHIYGMALYSDRLLFFTDWTGSRIGYVFMETGQVITMATNLYRPTAIAFQISRKEENILFSLMDKTKSEVDTTSSEGNTTKAQESTTFSWVNSTSAAENTTVHEINITETINIANETLSVINATDSSENTTLSWINTSIAVEETTLTAWDNNTTAVTEESTYSSSNTTEVLGDTTTSADLEDRCDPPTKPVTGGRLDCENNYCHLVCNEETHRLNPQFTKLAVPGALCRNGTWDNLPMFYSEQSCLEIRKNYRVLAEYRMSLKGRCISDQTELLAKMKDIILQKMKSRGICSSLKSGETPCKPQLKLNLNCHRKQKSKKKLLEVVSSSTQKKRRSYAEVTSTHSNLNKYNSSDKSQRSVLRPKSTMMSRRKNSHNPVEQNSLSPLISPSRLQIHSRMMWRRSIARDEAAATLNQNRVKEAGDLNTERTMYFVSSSKSIKEEAGESNGDVAPFRKLSTRSLREVAYNTQSEDADIMELFLTLQIDASGSPNEDNITDAIQAAAASLQDLVNSGRDLRVDSGQYESIPGSLKIISHRWTCPEGQIKVEEVCVACPRGSFHNNSSPDGASECSVCGPGTYQDLQAQTTCKLCPDGTVSLAGSTHVHQCSQVSGSGDTAGTPPVWNLLTVVIIASGVAAVTFAMLTCIICITHRRDRKVIITSLKDGASVCTKSTSDLSDYGETYDLREMRLYRNRMTNSQPDLLPMELICAWNPHDIPGTSTTSIPRSSTAPERSPGGTDYNPSLSHREMWEQPVGVHRGGRRLRTFRPKSGDLSVTFNDEKKSSF